MLSTILCLTLVANNVYLINFTLLALSGVVIHAIFSLNHLEYSKLLFNSYSNYDSLTLSIIIISVLIAIWLIAFYGEIIFTSRLYTVRLQVTPKSSMLEGTSLNHSFLQQTNGRKELKYSNVKNEKKIKQSKINNEFFGLILLLLIGLAGLITTNSYLSLFVAIELQSLTLYILFATNITNLILHNVSKVSLSYLINAAMATGLLLFGLSINSSLLVIIAIIWKLGVVPVHVWSLPILDNQHSLITSIYLTIAKYGTLLLISVIASTSQVSIELLTYVGLLNLTIGNVLGLLQYRYQRIIVYSSLVQIGYMLLIIGNESSLSLGYFEMYGFYTVILLMLWVLPNYNHWNSGRLLPQIQLLIMIFTLYTVAGLPFFPLFWTKLDILFCIQSESLIIALISTLLSSLIYVRLIKYMGFFKYN